MQNLYLPDTGEYEYTVMDPVKVKSEYSYERISYQETISTMKENGWLWCGFVAHDTGSVNKEKYMMLFRKKING